MKMRSLAEAEFDRDIRRMLDHAIDMAVEDGGDPSQPLMYLVERLGSMVGYHRPTIAVREARLRVNKPRRGGP